MTARWRVRPFFVLTWAVLVGVVALVSPLGAPAASAATGSCRAVSGAPAGGGGPQRATVVVDTGSGAVWSACISFSGSVSGIDALELAKAQIPDLAPVYDLYAGQGRAVCRLRGVGNDPPDCLGKTVEYWGYSHNGRYSSAGAGAITVRDGDVEGWRWGASGSAPRRATAGYEAAAFVAPPVTAPPTTRPSAPPTTAPAAPDPASPASSASSAGGAPAEVGGPAGGPAAGPASSGSGSITSTAPAVPASTATAAVDPASSPSRVASSGADAADPKDPGAAGGGAGTGAAPGDVELAAGAPGSPGGPSLDDADRGSSAGSVLGFVAALAALGGVGLVVRRRRTAEA